jgi:shikimate kinase
MSSDQEQMKEKMASHIVIVGFMGAGKSSVGRELARLLNDSFVDLDEYIARREGRTPQELIDVDGEPRFREIETRALAEVLSEDELRVVAAGGGAWTAAANRELAARRDCFIVWLDAPFDLCWERICGSGNSRPFARDEQSARVLHERRRATYALADRRVRVAAGQTAAEIAREITRSLSAREKG